MSLVESLNSVIGQKAEHLVELNEQRESLKEAESLYTDLYGGGMRDLMTRFGPLLAKLGIPAGVLATAADPGAFSGVFNTIGKVLGLFGVG